MTDNTAKPSITFIQNQYNELCRALGDAYLKRKQLDQTISELESQIQSLNSLTFPMLVKLEEHMQSDKESK